MSPSKEALRQWVDQLGTKDCQVAVVVEALQVSQRASVYSMLAKNDVHSIALDKSHLSFEWDRMSFRDNVLSRMDWQQVISGLLDGVTLYTEDDLRSVIDRGFTHGCAVLQALWTAKYMKEEGKTREVDVLVRALAKWTQGRQDALLQEESEALASLDLPAVPDTVERYDVFLLWLTLAKHNDLLDRVILVFDGFDRVETDATRCGEMDTFLRVAASWAALGSPLGVAIGVSRLPKEGTLLGNILHSEVVEHRI
jgi:hypothetical protein